MSTKRIPISFSKEFIEEYNLVKDLPNRSNFICNAIREKFERKTVENKPKNQSEIDELEKRIEILEDLIKSDHKSEVSDNINNNRKKGAFSLLHDD